MAIGLYKFELHEEKTKFYKKWMEYNEYYDIPQITKTLPVDKLLRVNL